MARETNQQHPSIDNRASIVRRLSRCLAKPTKAIIWDGIPEELCIDYMDLKTPTELWSKPRAKNLPSSAPNMVLQATEELDKPRLSDDGDFDILRSSCLVISERILSILVNAALTKMGRVRPDFTEDDERRVRFIGSLPTNVCGAFLDVEAG